MKKIALVVISCLISQGLLGSEEYPRVIDLDALVDEVRAQNNINCGMSLKELEALVGVHENEPNSYCGPIPVNSLSAAGLEGLTQATESQLQPENEDHPDKSSGKKSKSQKKSSPHICPHTDCGKSFTDFRNFKRHQRTHTGDKPFKCQHCGRFFSQLNNLQAHVRTHTGEKPYTCQQCGKSFTKSNDLRLHIRTHTGEKPYSCNQCGASFIRLNDVRTHARTHTGERPFKCEYCSNSFAQASSLRRHKKESCKSKPQ